jgi:hypothetical protein
METSRWSKNETKSWSIKIPLADASTAAVLGLLLPGFSYQGES